jgi:hypothetical protein
MRGAVHVANITVVTGTVGLMMGVLVVHVQVGIVVHVDKEMEFHCCLPISISGGGEASMLPPYHYSIYTPSHVRYPIIRLS